MFIKGKELHLVWCTKDIIYQAERNNITINEDEAIQGLEILLDRHDCNNGLSWDDIDKAIETIIEER